MSGAMQDLKSLFAEAGQRFGVSPTYLERAAQIESGLNPNARNPRSSAGGLFQFIDSTARQYGLDNKFDPRAATMAAAQLAADNKRTLEQALGRPVTDGELYLAHQQGSGGALKLLQNPSLPAAQLVGSAAAGLNGGQGLLASDFTNKWLSKFGGTSGGTSGGAAAQTAVVQQDQPRPTTLAALVSSTQPTFMGSFAQQLGQLAPSNSSQASDTKRRKLLFSDTTDLYS